MHARFRSRWIPILVCLAATALPCHGQDPSSFAGAQINQGAKLYNAGQYDQALTYFQKALDLFQRAENKGGIRTALTNIGLIYRTLGQARKALDYYERALAIADDSDPQGFAILLGNTGSVAITLGDLEGALDYLGRAAALNDKLGNKTGLAMNLDSIGQVFGTNRQFDKAIEYQLKALAIIEQAGDVRNATRILNNLGASGKGKGDYPFAVKYLERSLALKRRFATRDDIAASLTNIALIYFDQNKQEQACKAFEEAIILHEQISAEIRDASKVGDFQDWFRSSLYRRYAHALINLNRIDDALTVLERGRSQGLARQAAQNRADFSKVFSPADAKRMQDATNAYTAASSELNKIAYVESLADALPGTPAAKEVLDIRRRFEVAEQQLSALRADFGSRYPAYRRMSGAAAPSTADLKALAAKCPDTLFLQWAVGAEATSLLFAMSQKEGIKHFVIDVGETALNKQVKEWRAAIHSRDDKAEPAGAKALYTTLFGAIEKAGLLKDTQYNRLVLVGDGPLLELPYAALMNADGKRLIEVKPIATCGSFGVLGWPDDRAKPYAPALVIADPGSGDNALPAARAEGKAVAGCFAGAILAVGSSATRTNVMANIARSGILHFATHGALDEDDGLKSGLLLAKDKGEDEEPLLTAEELINSHLCAGLAVLSACETGQGQKSGGEGLLGLTWAFRAAGCPSIVASLWSVEDEATSKLMVKFYKEITRGQRKDDGLRAAMLEVKKTKPQPFYWAPFQLWGDASFIH